jgi:hypothetical protein
MKTESSLYVCVALVVLLATSLLVVPVAAQDSGQEEDDGGGDTIIEIDIDDIVDAIEDLADDFQDFTGDWDNTLQEVLTAVLFRPFRTLGQQILESLTYLLLNTPSVHPNPAIEEVHREVLLVTTLLSTVGFAAAGILYMIGPVVGISYSQVRSILPRLLLALIFSTVSLPLLQLAVDLTDALILAFAPEQLSMSFSQLFGFSIGLVLVWVIKAVLLLALAALFVIRDVYILFVAAISPLLALMWSFPPTKKYADTFIGGWIAALLIAPLDLLALKFSLALLRGNGATGIQSVSNWILGIGSLVLLLLIPRQLWKASQSTVGKANEVGVKLKNKISQRYGGREKAGNPDSLYRKQRRRNRNWGDD